MVRSGLNHRSDCQTPTENEYLGRHGHRMIGCRTCHAAAPLHMLRAQHTKTAPPRMEPTGAAPTYTLDCVRCDTAIPVTSSRPRVPLCDRCRGTGPKPSPAW